MCDPAAWNRDVKLKNSTLHPSSFAAIKSGRVNQLPLSSGILFQVMGKADFGVCYWVFMQIMPIGARLASGSLSGLVAARASGPAAHFEARKASLKSFREPTIPQRLRPLEPQLPQSSSIESWPGSAGPGPWIVPNSRTTPIGDFRQNKFQGLFVRLLLPSTSSALDSFELHSKYSPPYPSS